MVARVDVDDKATEAVFTPDVVCSVTLNVRLLSTDVAAVPVTEFDPHLNSKYSAFLSGLKAIIDVADPTDPLSCKVLLDSKDTTDVERLIVLTSGKLPL